MQTQFGPLRGQVVEAENAKATAVLLHGIGLGPWFWEPWYPTFREAGVRVVNLELPGAAGADAEGGLADIAEQVRLAVQAIGGPVVLVGHSAGALLAQMVAEKHPPQGLVLVCPVPPRQVQFLPERDELLAGLRMLPSVLAGKAITVPYEDYRRTSLASLDEAVAREVYARVRPWPGRLLRELALRPKVDPLAIQCPVLVALGYKDRLVPWQKARVLGDLYEGVVWRYDDLGHMPPFEDTGLRMARDVARFCVDPVRPQVIESEGFMPTEGVGHAVRRSRRGEQMKKRSAYGQKKAAR